MVSARQDLEADPKGEALSRFLAAHLVLERAVRRRVSLSQVTALLGVPLWLAIVLSWRRGVTGLVIAGFAASAVALFGAIIGEVLCRRGIRALSTHVRVVPVDLPGRSQGE